MKRNGSPNLDVDSEKKFLGKKYDNKKDNKSEQSSIDQLSQNNSLESMSIDNSVKIRGELLRRNFTPDERRK